MGRVADGSGQPVSGATVSLASNPGVATTTNAAGAYELRGVPGGPEFIVDYAKTGFAASQAIGAVTDGKYSTMNVVMIRDGHSATIVGGQDNVVADARTDNKNAVVTLPASSVVDASGTPVASASVTITTALPTDTGFNKAIPSSCEGTPEGKTNLVPLINHGLVNVTLKDAAGRALALDSSKPATIEFPIATGHDPGTPTVPLWSLDRTTGRWVQEGVATRDSSVNPPVYRGTVTHFSWWALNIYPETAQAIRVRAVQDPTITPKVAVGGAYVTIRRNVGAWEARGITSSPGGFVEFIVPPPGPYWMEAKKEYHEDKGVYSVTDYGTYIEVIYWLRPANTGAPGGG